MKIIDAIIIGFIFGMVRESSSPIRETKVMTNKPKSSYSHVDMDEGKNLIKIYVGKLIQGEKPTVPFIEVPPTDFWIPPNLTEVKH